MNEELLKFKDAVLQKQTLSLMHTPASEHNGSQHTITHSNPQRFPLSPTLLSPRFYDLEEAAKCNEQDLNSTEMQPPADLLGVLSTEETSHAIHYEGETSMPPFTAPLERFPNAINVSRPPFEPFTAEEIASCDNGIELPANPPFSDVSNPLTRVSFRRLVSPVAPPLIPFLL